MTEKLQAILENAKFCYRESIILNNRDIEDKLLSIIQDTSVLIEKNKTPKYKETRYSNNYLNESDEVAKIHRKIPKWLRSSNQINYKILTTFLLISDNNKYPVFVSSLEKKTNLDFRTFNTNYNQMKIIAPNNHAKVFEEINGQVSLWEPVAEFIIEEYMKVTKDIR